MRATFLDAPGEIRVGDTAEPTLEQPTDAIVELSASCICGSDLWSYRGINTHSGEPTRIGHEYCGIVTEVGADVTSIKVGQFVVGGFFTCDNTCPHCRAGFQSVCQHLGFYLGCQAERIRVAHADGTLVATDTHPNAALIPSLLACSDVMGTGWHAAKMASVQPGMTVAVVGDGAVGLCGVLAAAHQGAERIIAMSRHRPRQQLATEFGATEIVEERGDDGVARVLELTDQIGADAVLECVGTAGAMTQALGCVRPGGMVGFVGVPHGVDVPIRTMFKRNVGLRGGMAPVRQYLPELMELVISNVIDPGKVFDLQLPLEEAAEGYRAMDERRAVKVLLKPFAAN